MNEDKLHILPTNEVTVNDMFIYLSNGDKWYLYPDWKDGLNAHLTRFYVHAKLQINISITPGENRR